MTKLLYHPFTAFTVTLIAIIFLVSLNKSSQKTDISTKNIEVLEKEVLQMSNEIMETEEEIIETDSEIFKEKVIRNELLLQKPGEYIIQLPNLDNGETSGEVNAEKSEPIDEWLKLVKL